MRGDCAKCEWFKPSASNFGILSWIYVNCEVDGNSIRISVATCRSKAIIVGFLWRLCSLIVIVLQVDSSILINGATGHLIVCDCAQTDMTDTISGLCAPIYFPIVTKSVARVLVSFSMHCYVAYCDQAVYLLRSRGLVSSERWLNLDIWPAHSHSFGQPVSCCISLFHLACGGPHHGSLHR